jgi:PHP family Zn ribbon phosphoesterase
MYPCTKCLERNWKFELPDRETVRATCQNCGYEAEFPSRKRVRFRKSRPNKKPPVDRGPAEALFNPGQTGDGVAPW